MRRSCQYCTFRQKLSGAGGVIWLCDCGIDINLFKRLFGCMFFKCRFEESEGEPKERESK